jgi:hypothetical protein
MIADAPGAVNPHPVFSSDMKRCTWCGKEYPDTAEICVIDGQPLSGGKPQPARDGRSALQTEETPVPSYRPLPSGRGPDWHPRLISLDTIEGAFAFREGFSRPDWKIIAAAIQKAVPPENVPQAWTEAAIQWGRQVATDLGGEYGVRRSEEFILVSALEPAAADQLLIFAERTLEQLYALLNEAAWKSGFGPRVIFLFAEDDDYYQYVSYFYRDGVHSKSGGCLIHGGGYVHIAMPHLNGRNIRQALAHELMHNCVVHLRLPLWLNEGLAVVFDRTVSQGRQPILDGDLRDRHLAFWNEENIQKFWAGVSFGEPGDSNELSYSLAEILISLLLSEAKDFGAFVKEADWNDGGQTAALEFLGRDLGQTAATFFGEGEWRPKRKAMVECWNAKKQDEGKQK